MENFLLIKKKEDNNLEKTDLLYMDKNKIAYGDVELSKLFNGCHFYSREQKRLSFELHDSLYKDGFLGKSKSFYRYYNLMCENNTVIDKSSFCQFTTYMNGRANGLCEIYYLDEKNVSFDVHESHKLYDISRILRGYYNNGKKDGIWKEYLVKPAFYFKDRFINIFSNFREDENEFAVRWYVTYQNDVLEGLSYNMGALSSEIGYYKNGNKEGLWKEFNSQLFVNDNKLVINNLNDEEIDNFCRTNKDISCGLAEGNYSNGDKEGEWKQVFRDQIRILIYKNGKVIND